jgi:predicted nucleic acid-binding protein
VILLDTSGLLAWIDAGQRRHAEVAAAMANIAPPFVLSPFVLAEIDYLLAERVGPAAERALLAEVEGGAFELPVFDAADIGAALRVIERFSDLRIGLADASLVVLSERYRTLTLLSLDERHFRALRGHRGRPFELIPETR